MSEIPRNQHHVARGDCSEQTEAVDVADSERDIEKFVESAGPRQDRLPNVVAAPNVIRAKPAVAESAHAGRQWSERVDATMPASPRSAAIPAPRAQFAGECLGSSRRGERKLTASPPKNTTRTNVNTAAPANEPDTRLIQ